MTAGDKMTDTAGWPVLHRYYQIDRARWSSLGGEAREAAIEEFSEWLTRTAAEDALQLVPMAGIAKSDLALMAVHPELSRIQQLGQEIAATTLGACLVPTYSFLSLSEVSEYATTPGDWARHLIDEKRMDPQSPDLGKEVADFKKRMEKYADARVHPVLPTDFPVVCFYPMRKSREAGRNWYTLEFEQRKKLMIGHGAAGRRFAGRVLQLITSCTGLDDWEWAVTLFARDLQSVRDVVYEMRYDPTSAVYAEFGEFYIAVRFAPQDLARVLRL